MRQPAPRTNTRPIDVQELVITVATAGAVTAMLYVLPLWVGLTSAGIAVAAYGWIAAARAVALRHVLGDIEAKRRTSQHLRDINASRPAQETPSNPYEHRFEQVHEALRSGFPDTALEQAKQLVLRTKIPFDERIGLMRSVLEWHAAAASASVQGEHRRFDVVIISHFGLPGGNTSANIADIEALRAHGFRVGLLHHTVFKWGPNAPMNSRIEALFNDEGVVRIGLHDEVTCGLAVVRLPTVLLHPLEERPNIKAGHTVVIANQTPFKFYGNDGPREVAWDIATVEKNVGDWLGSHTWYAGGPTVHDVLTEHHSEEIANLDLAFMPWNECINITQWQLEGRREIDGRIRIGRHSRDHKLKWPEDPNTLLQCYPEREPFEVHVLGGTDVPTKILRELPSNWTTHPFNDLSAKEFLKQIDIMVYFIASDGMEAFGRAPLESMAAGVPVIMDRRFEPTFGPAAIYCSPSEVASTAERLMSDPSAYAAQQSFAWTFIDERFSGKALVERLSLHGVTPEARG